MRVTLSIDANEYIEIGHSNLATIVGWLDDEMQHAFFFLGLVKHSSSEVRSAVACKTALPIDALEAMVNDTSIEVVRQLANNERALKLFDFNLLQEMIQRDVSIAVDLANNLSILSEKMRKEIIPLLLQHPDPAVVDIANGFDGESW